MYEFVKGLPDAVKEQLNDLSMTHNIQICSMCPLLFYGMQDTPMGTHVLVLIYKEEKPVVKLDRLRRGGPSPAMV